MAKYNKQQIKNMAGRTILALNGLDRPKGCKVIFKISSYTGLSVTEVEKRVRQLARL